MHFETWGATGLPRPVRGRPLTFGNFRDVGIHGICPSTTTGKELVGAAWLERLHAVACMTDARRHVHECLASHPQHSSVLLAMFRQLSDIEDRAKELSTDGRLALGQTESVPVLNRMRTYLDSGAVIATSRSRCAAFT